MQWTPLRADFLSPCFASSASLFLSAHRLVAEEAANASRCPVMADVAPAAARHTSAGAYPMRIGGPISSISKSFIRIQREAIRWERHSTMPKNLKS